MHETPDLRWFDEHGRCACGKPSAGLLRGTGNASYGAHCRKCAERRLKASEVVRSYLRNLGVTTHADRA